MSAHMICPGENDAPTQTLEIVRRCPGPVKPAVCVVEEVGMNRSRRFERAMEVGSSMLEHKEECRLRITTWSEGFSGWSTALHVVG